MPRNLRTRIIIVLVVLLGSLWYVYPPKKAINLGLDLQGGIHLVLGVETDKHVANQTDRAAEDFAAALERRGIAHRRVARDGLAAFVVELASPQSWNDAITVANEFQTFERSNDDQAAGRFRMAMSARVQRQVREDAAKQVLEKLRNRIDKFNVAEPTIARQGEDRTHEPWDRLLGSGWLSTLSELARIPRPLGRLGQFGRFGRRERERLIGNAVSGASLEALGSIELGLLGFLGVVGVLGRVPATEVAFRPRVEGLPGRVERLVRAVWVVRLVGEIAWVAGVAWPAQSDAPMGERLTTRS